MEIYELPDKELKVIILKKLSEMQENTNRQQNKSRRQYVNKMRSLIKRGHKKEPKKNPGAIEYNDRTEKLNRELQQQT